MKCSLGRRCRIKLTQEKKNASVEGLSKDLKELKGCIELGFGFNDDKGGQSLTKTLPALDIYFDVNRLGSPVVSPTVPKFDRIGSSSYRSEHSLVSSEGSWKICGSDFPKTLASSGIAGVPMLSIPKALI
ncbi:hypothetical protein Tco_0643676 [Tanacetum coccineum]